MWQFQDFAEREQDPVSKILVMCVSVCDTECAALFYLGSKKCADFNLQEVREVQKVR